MVAPDVLCLSTVHTARQVRQCACRSNGETTFEQDIIKKSRCEVHVFDPTLDEAVAAQVRAIKGVTFHPYGLGAIDGVVRFLAVAAMMHRFDGIAQHGCSSIVVAWKCLP